MNGMLHAHSKKKYKGIWLLLCCVLFVICSILVYADAGNFYVDGVGTGQNETDELTSCGSINGTSFLEDVPYYVGLGEYKNLDVALMNNGSKLNDSVINVQATFNMTSWYNMTYSNTTGDWRIYVTSNEDETSDIFVRMTSSTYNCINSTYTIKFRQPYWVTVKLFTSNKTSQQTPHAYVNDFNYVYFEKHNGSGSLYKVPNQADMSNTMRNIYSFVPGIEGLYKRTVDKTIVHWADYQDGYAIVKLYDLGAYNIYVMSHSVSGLDWDYEFFKPQQADIKVDTKIEKQINITTRGNYTANIYISKFEADKIGYMMNLVYVIFVVIGVIIALGGIAMMPGMSKIVAPIAVAVVLWALKYVFGI